MLRGPMPLQFLFRQVLQKSLAAFCNIVIGDIKVAGIPRVSDVTGRGRKVQKTEDFSIRIASGNAAHVGNIAGIHAQKIIIGSVILARHLNSVFSGCGNAVSAQLLTGSRVNGVSNLLRAGGSGSDEKLLLSV